MKVTLTFDGEDARSEAIDALNSVKYSSLIWEFDQYLRGRLKYEDKLTEDGADRLQEVRDKLHDLMNEYNLSFD